MCIMEKREPSRLHCEVLLLRREKSGVRYSSESLPVPDKYRGGCSQPTIGVSTRSPMEELEKGLKELKDLAAPFGCWD